MRQEVTTTEIMEFLRDHMVTKEDLDARLDARLDERLKPFATKDDLKRFATKDDLKRFATKDDLKRFATKDDLKRFATKDDLKQFPTKDDLDLRLFAVESRLSERIDRCATKDELRAVEGRLMDHIDGTMAMVGRLESEVYADRARIERIERRTGIAEG